MLTIRGMVGHGFGGKERFDFNGGQPGSNSAAMLEGAGEAEPFQAAYDRYQDVETEPHYEPGFKEDCNLFRAAVIRVEEMPRPLSPLARHGP